LSIALGNPDLIRRRADVLAAVTDAADERSAGFTNLNPKPALHIRQRNYAVDGVSLDVRAASQADGVSAAC
jgi:hypothetical protein